MSGFSTGGLCCNAALGAFETTSGERFWVSDAYRLTILPNDLFCKGESLSSEIAKLVPCLVQNKAAELSLTAVLVLEYLTC